MPRKGYEVCVDGEIKIRFKQSRTIKDIEKVISNDEIKKNIILFVKDDLEDTFDEIEVELVDCNIQKKII